MEGLISLDDIISANWLTGHGKQNGRPKKRTPEGIIQVEQWEMHREPISYHNK